MTDFPPKPDDQTRRTDGNEPDLAAGAFHHPSQVGPYRILRPIGQGGMGTVYEAEQASPERIVALKVIRPGLATPEHLRRFELESVVLGRLQHPGIAQVYEAGTADAGFGTQPFFAMEYIQGLPLLKHADKYGLGIRERLQLVARISDAVHHAHLRGVIHRDLKPGNILVTKPGPAEIGRPKILDFGVARIADADIQMTVHQTHTGQIIGTLPYMSPEQVSGDPDALDVRSDVYALGVLLYEILSGHMPLDLSKRQIPEAVRMIQEEEPSRLSEHDHRLSGDLEVIVGKALEKEKDRRYQSAEELADDLRRFLEDRPIAARPPSTAYQVRKFAQRNRALVGGVAVAFALLIAGTTVSTWQAIRATRAETVAGEEAASAALVNEFLSDMIGGMDTARMGNTLVSELLDRAEHSQSEQGIPPEDIDYTRSMILESLRGVNRADVAREVVTVELLERAEESIARKLEGDPALAARLRHTLGNTYLTMGEVEIAREQFEAAYELRATALGPDARETLESRHKAIRTDIGKSAATQDSVNAALLALSRSVLGEHHQLTLDAVRYQGFIQHHLRNWTAADSLYRYVYEHRLQTLGPDHEQTLESMVDVADMHKHLERVDEAEAMFIDGLARHQRLMGDDHPQTLTVMQDLAQLYEDTSRYPQAASWYRRLLESRTRSSGEEHPNSHGAKNLLTRVLEVLHEYPEAEAMLQQVLAERLLVLEPGDPRLWSSRYRLARLYSGWRRFDEAIRYHEEIMEVYRQRDEHDTERVARGKIDLGDTYREAGRHAEAERLYREAARIYRDRRGDDAAGALRAELQLARLYEDLGNFADAEPLYRSTMKGRRRTLGDRHRLTIECTTDLGRLLVATGRDEEARPLLLQVLDVRRQAASGLEIDAGGPGKVRIECAELLLAEYMNDFRDPEEALRLALDANERSGFSVPPHLSTLAEAYHANNELELAVETQRKAVDLLPPEVAALLTEYEEDLAMYEAATKAD